jgi:hypothetical protein
MVDLKENPTELDLIQQHQTLGLLSLVICMCKLLVQVQLLDYMMEVHGMMLAGRRFLHQVVIL